MDRPVLTDRKGHRDLQEIRAHKELRVLREPPELQDPKGQLVGKAHQDRRDHKDCQGLQDQVVRKAIRG